MKFGAGCAEPGKGEAGKPGINGAAGRMEQSPRIRRGCGSKICTQSGILANGHMGQNLRSPGGLILTHTHMALDSRCDVALPIGSGDLGTFPQEAGCYLLLGSNELQSACGWDAQPQSLLNPS